MSRAQFHGEPSNVHIPVPAPVKRAAELALKLRDQYGFQGATSTGWKRAVQLATKSHVSIEDFRFIRNWYARHVFVSKPGYDAWTSAGSPKTPTWAKHHAICSWLTWGGNPGLTWVNQAAHLNVLSAHFGKPYRKVVI